MHNTEQTVLVWIVGLLTITILSRISMEFRIRLYNTVAPESRPSMSDVKSGGVGTKAVYYSWIMSHGSWISIYRRVTTWITIIGASLGLIILILYLA